MLFFLLAALYATVGTAQVIRCTDARTKEITYTNGTCSNGAKAHEVEARKTPEEIQLEREQAAQALALKQQRLQMEAAAVEAEAARNLERDRARAAQTAAMPHDYARSPECARARRNLEQATANASSIRNTFAEEALLESAQRQADLECLGPQAYAELEKARAAQPRVVVVPSSRRSTPVPFPNPPTHPRYLTQCSQWRCTDNQGSTYPRTGPGRFPGERGICRSNGGQAPC